MSYTWTQIPRCFSDERRKAEHLSRSIKNDIYRHLIHEHGLTSLYLFPKKYKCATTFHITNVLLYHIHGNERRRPNNSITEQSNFESLNQHLKSTITWVGGGGGSPTLDDRRCEEGGGWPGSSPTAGTAVAGPCLHGGQAGVGDWATRRESRGPVPGRQGPDDRARVKRAGGRSTTAACRRGRRPGRDGGSGRAASVGHLSDLSKNGSIVGGA
jgi:hypothetical protein